MRLVACVAGLMLAAPTFGESERSWSVVPGFYQPGGAGIEVLDIDGDGTQEAVISGTSDGGFGQGGSRFLAVLEQVAGDLEITGVARLRNGESFTGDLRRVPGTEGAQRFAIPLLSNDQRLLAVYAGNVPARVAEIPLPANFYLDGIADVDGDGELEIYGRRAASSYLGEGRPEVRDFASGALEWAEPTRTTRALGAGQLDADPALELVFGATNSGDGSGYVLDGATHVTHWSYADGFRGTPVFGNFDTQPSTREFAIVEPWGTTRVFVTSPFFSPLSEYPTGEVQAITVRDVDGDSVDEIIVGEGQWGSIIAYKPTTWTKTFEQRNPEHGVSAVALGQLDGDANLEVVFGAGLTSSGADLLQVFDAGSGALQFSRIDAAGPHAATLVADLDGNGRPELVWATLYSDSGYSGPNLVVADAESGVELRRLNSVLDPWGSNPGTQLLAANVDADPALEIVVGGGQLYSGSVRVLDGVTLQEQWVVTLPGVDVVTGLVAIDANADAVPDIAIAAQGRVIVLNGANGTELWRSVSVTSAWNQTVALGEIDADPAREILFSVGNSLHVIDTVTRLFERSIAHGAPILSAATEGSGGACRIIVYEATRLVRRRCDTGAIDSLREYGLTALMVRPLTDSLGSLVLSDGTQLKLLQGNVVVEESEPVGPQLGWNNLGTVQITGEGIEVYTGDLIATHRFILAKTRLMRDGFEAPTAASLPESTVLAGDQ